jgi:hypothetical protein
MGLREAVYRVTVDLEGHDIENISGYITGVSRRWEIKPVTIELCYHWSPLVGYWKVMGSKVRGRPMTRKSPDEHTWMNHDVTKPLWVTVLEHNHYPKGNPR